MIFHFLFITATNPPSLAIVNLKVPGDLIENVAFFNSLGSLSEFLVSLQVSAS
jgi:hypothetical protein